jgi:hypothetical protein
VKLEEDLDGLQRRNVQQNKGKALLGVIKNEALVVLLFAVAHEVNR